MYFFEDVIFEDCNFKNSIEFINCKFKKRLHFLMCSSTVVENNSIDIRCVFTEIQSFWLNNNKNKFGVLEFEECKNCGDLFLLSPNFEQMLINKSLFITSTQIENGEINYLHFSENVFECAVSITSLNIQNAWTMHGNHFKKSITYRSIIDSTRLDYLLIHSSIFNESFLLTGGGQTLNKLLISCSNQLEGRLHFTSFNFEEFSIEGSN